VPLPPGHKLKETKGAFAYKPDPRKLAESAIGRSDADFAKAAKTFEREPEAAKKKLFHALRVPMFARQLKASGRIVDYAEASPLWAEIRDREGLDWDEYQRAYGPLREQICEELRAAGKRR
jgi:hypothetical protein